MGAVPALNRWRLSKVLQAEEQELSKQTRECNMLWLERAARALDQKLEK